MKNRWSTRIVWRFKGCCGRRGSISSHLTPPPPRSVGAELAPVTPESWFQQWQCCQYRHWAKCFPCWGTSNNSQYFGEAELQAAVATAAFSFGSNTPLPSEVQHTIWWIPHSVLQLQFIKRWIKTLAQQWPQEYFSSNIIPEGFGDAELCLNWDIIHTWFELVFRKTMLTVKGVFCCKRK